MIDCRQNRLAEAFISTYKTKKTQDGIRQQLTRFFNFIFQKLGTIPADVDFNRFTPVRVGREILFYIPINQAFISEYLYERYKINNATRSHYDALCALKMFFQYCLDREYISSNPAEGIPFPKLNKKVEQTRILSETECWQLLDGVRKMGLPRFTLIYLLLGTGGRTGEVISLTRSNIDFYLDQVYMYGKTGLRRRPLVPGLKETLLLYFESSYYQKLVAKANKDYVFFSEKKADGSPLNTDELNAIIKEISYGCGINKNITSYWFRITFVNILHDNGVRKPILQQIMDWDKFSTVDIYLAKRKNDSVSQCLEKSSLTRLVLDTQNSVIRRLTNSLIQDDYNITK